MMIFLYCDILLCSNIETTVLRNLDEVERNIFILKKNSLAHECLMRDSLFELLPKFIDKIKVYKYSANPSRYNNLHYKNSLRDNCSISKDIECIKKLLENNYVEMRVSQNTIGDKRKNDFYLDLIELTIGVENKNSRYIEIWDSTLFYKFLKDEYDEMIKKISFDNKNMFIVNDESRFYVLNDKLRQELEKISYKDFMKFKHYNKSVLKAVISKYKVSPQLKYAIIYSLLERKKEFFLLCLMFPEFYGSILCVYSKVELLSFRSLVLIYSIYKFVLDMFLFKLNISYENLTFKEIKEIYKQKYLNIIIKESLDAIFSILNEEDYDKIRKSLYKFKLRNNLSFFSPSLISLKIISFFIVGPNYDSFINYLEDLQMVTFDGKEYSLKISSAESFRMHHFINSIYENPLFRNLLVTTYQKLPQKYLNDSTLSKVINFYKKRYCDVINPTFLVPLHGINVMMPFLRYLFD